MSLRSPVELAGAATVVASVAVLGFALQADDPLASPLTPATGVAIALLYLGGLRLWPAVIAGFAGAELAFGATAGIAVLDGAATAVEAVAGATLLSWALDRSRPFARVREVAAVLPLLAVAVPLAGALLAAAGRWVLGVSDAPGVIEDWWLGDGVGVLVATPLVVVWSRLPRLPWHGGAMRRYAGVAAASAAVAAFVFAHDTGRVTELYLLLPLAMAAALIGGRHAAVATTAVVTAIGVAATALGHGPVATGDVLGGLATLDGFLAAFALAGLVLAAVDNDRRLAEAHAARARGAAHDVSNLLLAVRGYAELAREGVRRGDPAAADELSELLHATERAVALTRGSLVPGAADLVEVVRDTARILPPLLGDRVDLRMSMPAKPVVVDADRTQLERVLINLAVNASNAMPQGGPLEISVGDATLTVTDAGCGIEERVLERIFEPDFTTREQGHGIGLASVHSIVNQLGGRISVASRPGAGSSFTVHLPEPA